MKNGFQALSLIVSGVTFLSAGCGQPTDGKLGAGDVANSDGPSGLADASVIQVPADLGAPVDLKSNKPEKDADSTDDLAPAQPADHDPTVHTPEPTVHATSKGTIAALEIWTIVWKGDDAEGMKVNQFMTSMFASSYWTNWGKEYGVGAGQVKGLIVLSDAPPAKYTDSQAISLIKKSVGTTGWPTKIDSSTVFSFIFNPSTSLTDSSGSVACNDYDGYHTATSDGTPYIMAFRCVDPTTMTDSFDDLSVTLSHEAAETATDPQVNGLNSATRYIYDEQEVGDICSELDPVTITDAMGTTYSVQRLYSDAAALAGTSDPCVPGDGPFFGACVSSTNTDTTEVIIKTVNGAGSATFNLETFSESDVGPIYFGVMGFPLPAGVTFSPDYRWDVDDMGNWTGITGDGFAGTTFPVTVTVDKTVQKGVYSLLIPTQTDSNRYNTFWATLRVQ